MTEQHIRRWQMLFTALALSGVIALAIIGGILYFEQPFLTYVRLPFPTLKPAYRPGEVVTLLVRRCNSSREARLYGRGGQLKRVDKPQPAAVLASGQTPIDAGPACFDGISHVNMLPQNTPAGRYFIDGLSNVDGRVRNFTVPWRSAEFDVALDAP